MILYKSGRYWEPGHEDMIWACQANVLMFCFDENVCWKLGLVDNWILSSFTHCHWPTGQGSATSDAPSDGLSIIFLSPMSVSVECTVIHKSKKVRPTIL